jgi:chaperonin GroEL (HSP60 family)
MMGQPVLILKQGTQREQGEPALILNIDAGSAIADAVRTTLGPKGMDKMLVDGVGDTIVTNDGVTILKELDVEHPAAKMVIEAAKTQDDECGDGTTTTVILTGELLQKAKPLIKESIHPTVIVEGYQLALKEAKKILKTVTPELKAMGEHATLMDVASTSMTGKTTEESKGELATLVVDAIMAVAEQFKDKHYEVDLENVNLVKMKGKAIENTERVNGLVIMKEKASKGMHCRQASDDMVMVGLLSGSLRVKDHKVNIQEVDELDRLVERDELELNSMIEGVRNSMVDVLFVQKDISDEAAAMLEEVGIVGYRRVSEDEMDMISRATGATIVSKTGDLVDKCGRCLYGTDKHEGANYVFLKGRDDQESFPVQTIIVRGATDHVVDEIERSIHDALSTVAVALEDGLVCIGGGGSFIEIVLGLEKYANTIEGRRSFAVKAFAEAMESIPRTLAENAGLDKIDTILALRKSHAEGGLYHGINVTTGTVEDMRVQCVVEPHRLVEQALIGAVETANMILRIDDVIASKGMDLGPGAPGGAQQGPPPGMG